jgi:hypothetical protein
VLKPDGKASHLTATFLLGKLCQAASIIGKNDLVFEPNELGLHSLRSGAAMAMYLAGCAVFTIMLIGCWSSDAFLNYIRPQVSEFSLCVSEKMILHEEFYRP